jgi:hypothetical protein
MPSTIYKTSMRIGNLPLSFERQKFAVNSVTKGLMNARDVFLLPLRRVERLLHTWGYNLIKLRKKM